MGAADVVPGVSGGTIAFITGIYGRLIQSLKSADLECVRLLCRLDFKAVWRRVDGGFLLTLMAGILTAIFSLAHGIDYLLDHHPILIWSVFFGLIASSAFILMLKNGQIKPAPCLFLALGIGVMVLISQGSFIQLPATLPFIFLAGVIAISAMLLPGLSGSFLLLMFGLYEPMLESVKALNLAVIASFGLGAVTGLLLFSRFIHWLLKHYYTHTLMLLTGLLLGSLYEIWPWKLVKEGFIKEGIIEGSAKTPVLPGTFEQYGQDAMLYAALGCMISAIVFVLLLEYISGRFSREDNHNA